MLRTTPALAAILLVAASCTQAPPPEAGGSSTAGKPGLAEAIRPFRVHVSDDALTDLRRRIAATKWPQPELFVAELRAGFTSLR